MKVPVSWLKEFVELELSIPDLAHRLTLAGMEVEEIRYVGFLLLQMLIGFLKCSFKAHYVVVGLGASPETAFLRPSEDQWFQP